MGVAMRRGEQYLASLRDGRAVFLDGARVADVTGIPPSPSRSGASPTATTPRSPTPGTAPRSPIPSTGKPIGAMWLVPRSAEDLGRRRAVHRFWAEGSFGLMGRTPDHVACVLTGLRGLAAAVRPRRRRASATTWSASTRGRARRTSTCPTRSCRRRSTAAAGPQAPRAVPASRRRRARRTRASWCAARRPSRRPVTMADWLFVSYITPLCRATRPTRSRW